MGAPEVDSRPERDHSGEYRRRLQLLKHKVDALINGNGRPDIVQLRAALHELINELERRRQLGQDHREVVAEARDLLSKVPERQKPGKPTVAISAGSVVRGSDVASQTAGTFVHRLRRIEDEIDKLPTDRDGFKRAGRSRRARLERALTRLAREFTRVPRGRSQLQAFLAEVERNRKRLAPPGATPKKRRASRANEGSTGISAQARRRAAIELDRATRQDSSSVRTISGGLPGLGKRH